MSRRWAIIVVVVSTVLILVALALYVGLSVAGDLGRAESRARSGIGRLDVQRMAASVEAVESAQARLSSMPARILRRVPGLGSNVRSAESVVEAALPASRAAVDAVEALSAFEGTDLMEGGRVSIDAIESLEAPLARQEEALERLLATASGPRSRWLLPPVWNGIEAVEERTRRALRAAAGARAMASAGPRFLGDTQPQQHLVLLLNNSELRGAGGVLTGVGLLEADRGRLSLGGFTSVHSLRERPPRRVPAPEDFVRRYSTYKADTTLWLNTSFSPQVPHVASVARALYERVEGVSTDGVIVMDPRGLASFLHPDAVLEVPGHRVRARRLARYIYSDAYSRFADQPQRREAIIDLGERAFQRVMEDGLARPQLITLGEAMAGGHIRLLSEDEEVAEAFKLAGVTGDVEPQEDEHGVMVAAQNFGEGGGQGTKLDYWTERTIEMDCSVATSGATCRLDVGIANEVPAGLDSYVAGRPYGVLRSYVETFVPGEAEVRGVTVDGEPHEFRLEPYVGMRSVGVYLEVEAGGTQDISIAFELPPDDAGYALILIPQPLARDARLRLQMDAPAGWSMSAGGQAWEGEEIGVTFTGRVLVEARPDERSGLPKLWNRIRRFFSEPVPWF